MTLPWEAEEAGKHTNGLAAIAASRAHMARAAREAEEAEAGGGGSGSGLAQRQWTQTAEGKWRPV